MRLFSSSPLLCHVFPPQKQSSYNLTIKGIDMNGAPNGNTGTGTMQIIVMDINDNRPVLEKDEVLDV